MKNLRNLFVVLVITSVVFAAGCGKKDALPEEIKAMLDDTSGKVARLGVYGDPMSLNPLEHSESEHGQLVNNFVHAAPLRKLADGSFVPYLFDEYYLSLGENGTVILDALWKKGLKWHDGSDFDPRALEFTIRAMQDPQLESPYADLAKGVLSVNSIGQGQRCHMVFAGNSRQYLDLLCVGILPAHLIGDYPLKAAEATASASTDAGIATPAYNLAAFAEKPVGLGPYMIKAREKGSFIHLVPNPYFFDALVASRPAVIVRSSFDFQQLISDFRANRYDWINLPSMLAEQLETMKIEQVKFVRYPNPASMVWMFNCRHPVLSDARVRRALDLVINRQTVRNQFAADGEVLYQNPLASGSTVATDYETRFAGGIKLLDEAGLVDRNNDGLRDSASSTFEISILINDDNLTRRVVAEKMIEDLRRAGIKANVEAVSWSDFVSVRLRKAEFSTALLSLTLPAAGNWMSVLHSSPGILDNLNFAGVNDPQLDKDLELLDSMLANPEKEAALARVAAYLNENMPMAFLIKPWDVGLYHAEAGRATAPCSIWNDVLNWKLLFGTIDSKL